MKYWVGLMSAKKTASESKRSLTITIHFSPMHLTTISFDQVVHTLSNKSILLLRDSESATSLLHVCWKRSSRSLSQSHFSIQMFHMRLLELWICTGIFSSFTLRNIKHTARISGVVSKAIRSIDTITLQMMQPVRECFKRTFRLVRSTRMFSGLRECLTAMAHRLFLSELRQAERQVILILASLTHQHMKPMMWLRLRGSWSSK
jgi:hypothetical protein